MKRLLLFPAALLFFIIHVHAQVTGCPDPAANNYNSTATENNGSCTYNNATLNPKLKFNLNTILNESSGLIFWNKLIWSHNDSGNDPVIYGLNNKTGVIQRTVSVSNAGNVDWEDIAQDNTYIYIGDFGNNANGNRTDLKIYRISKADVNTFNSVTASVINFSYNDQTDFSPKGSNNTNFDCEAMIAYGDSLFVFSKNWIDNKTRLYKLPKTPGTFIATKMNELNVSGLITGADILSEQRVIALSGYSAAYTPFIYLLYDFTGNNFFGANKRKVALHATSTKTEGICVKSPTKLFISNERYTGTITTVAKVDQLNLASLLNPYYQSGSSLIPTADEKEKANNLQKISFVSVQSIHNNLYIKKATPLVKDGSVEIYNTNGVVKLHTYFTNIETAVDISTLTNGIYVVKVFNKEQQLTVKVYKE